MNDVSKMLPPMKLGNELTDALAVLPPITVKPEDSATDRLIALLDIYHVFVPGRMATEIYSKLYLTLLRSLQKKRTQIAIRQQYENLKRGMGMESEGLFSEGISGGIDSWLLVAPSGTGKTTSISRALALISQNQIIETTEPYSKIIPYLTVQCPHDASVKGLLYDILRKVDERLSTDYYNISQKYNVTIDLLIGTVSRVAISCIGTLIVDEAQHLIRGSKQGQTLANFFITFTNSTGVGLVFVGTPECNAFFQETSMQLSRRALGLTYQALPYGAEFRNVCEKLYKYQYVEKKTEITEGIIAWLYEHTGGIVANLVTLLYSAQELAILSGREVLDMVSLREAYDQRLTTMHQFVDQSITFQQRTSSVKSQSVTLEPSAIEDANTNMDFNIADLVKKAKMEQMDIVELLRERVCVEEVLI
jgi:hypothetical protein